MSGGAEVPERWRDAHRFAFGDLPGHADLLLELVLAGVKTATCGALRMFGDAPGQEPMPRVGRQDVVLDGAGRPAVVIETVSLRVCRYDEVEPGFMLAEGEGTAADWDRDHRAYFERTGGFSPDMEVVCERFRLVEVLPRDAVAPALMSGWRPGLLGEIVRAHGTFYAREWGFDHVFEAAVAAKLGALAGRHDPARDLIRSASAGGRFAGSAVIDGAPAGGHEGWAQFRFFIVTPEGRGSGLGRRLLDDALAFADAHGVPGVFLETFAGLDRARALYEAAGFRLVHEAPDRTWGPEMTEQRWERPRPA